MSTCLITGGAGFLGSHMCDHLLAAGHRVICVDNLDTGSLQNIQHIRSDEFTFVQHDLTQPFHTDEPIDHVYHLASPASPIDYLRLPLHTLKVGSYGTHHMLGLAKKHRARFVLASTSEVYGDPQVHPQPETYWGHVNPIGPRGVYDEAKRYAEALTMAYHRQQGVDTGIVEDVQLRARRRAGALRRRARAAPRARRPARRADGELCDVRPCTCPGTRAAAGSRCWTARVRARSSTRSKGSPCRPSRLAGGSSPRRRCRSSAIRPDQRCYEVKTRYGRSVRVTGDHSIFVEGADGEPVPKPVNDIEIGERVALMGRIDVPERDRRAVSMIEVWRWAENDPWDLYAERARPRRGGLGTPERPVRPVGLERVATTARTGATGPGRRSSACASAIGCRCRRSGGSARRYRMAVAFEHARAGAARRCRRVIEITDEFLWFLGVWVAEGSWYEGRKGGFLSIASDEDVVNRAADFVRTRTSASTPCARRHTGTRPPPPTSTSKLLLRLMEFLGFGHRKRGSRAGSSAFP